jgi:hypothetical protein
MADEVDRANDQAEAYLDARLREARKIRKVHATGNCLNCESLLPPGLLYCDSACREDHEHRSRMETRCGADE